MKNFIKSFIFIIPIVSFYVMFLVAGLITGELLDFDQIIHQQNEAEQEQLIGMGYSEQSPYLKISNINSQKPEVVAFGTSRVMQFKREFFNTSFYNGGGIVQNISEYKKALEKINDVASPKLIIVEMDWCQFNPNWIGYMGNRYYHDESSLKKEIDVKKILNNEWEDYKKGKWRGLDIMIRKNHNKGFNGYFNNKGFMKDGSYYYGDLYDNVKMGDRARISDSINRIKDGRDRFEYGTELGQEALNALEEFVSLCKERNIELVGFTGPFAPTVIDKMAEYNSNYDYVAKLPIECQKIFEHYNFEFYDYTDMRYLGCDDSYYIDGFHAGDIGYILLLKDMLEKNSILRNYIKKETLDNLLETRYSNLLVRSIQGENSAGRIN